MNSEFPEPSRSADIIMIEGIAAVDHCVARIEQRCQQAEQGINRCGRHHHPNGTRFCEPLHKTRQIRRALSSLFNQRAHQLRMAIVNDAFMTSVHESHRHIGTHSTKTDHAKLHLLSPTSEADDITKYSTRRAAEPVERQFRCFCWLPRPTDSFEASNIPVAKADWRLSCYSVALIHGPRTARGQNESTALYRFRLII